MNILQTLLHPLTRDEFFERHWPRGTFVHHGTLDRLTFLADMQGLADVHTLAARWSGTITAWPRPRSGLPELEATPPQIEALRSAGYTLFFRDVQAVLPSVRRLCSVLATELGVDVEQVICEAFYSPAGSGAPPHFDGNWGFNVQLAGEKEWEVAPNEHFVLPEVGMAMGSRPDPRIRDYATMPLPTRMPDEAARFTVRPGSVVFVPCGMWHRTNVLSDSAAVIFTIKPRPWAALVTNEIAKRLSRRLDTARATPLPANANLHERQAQELDAVVGALRAIVSELDAPELLETWRSRLHSSFALRRGISIEVSEREGDEWTLAVGTSERRHVTAIERSAGAVLRWVASRSGPIALADALAAFPRMPPDEVRERLADLSRARLLVESSLETVTHPNRRSHP
jgi:50S ribosomal protein L16 3-hydroxylase